MTRARPPDDPQMCKRPRLTTEGAHKTALQGDEHNTANASGAQDQRFAVLITKASGTRIVFCHSLTRAAADKTVCGLRAIGLPAEVAEGLDPKLRPGTRVEAPR